jgi:hypothetical protein
MSSSFQSFEFTGRRDLQHKSWFIATLKVIYKEKKCSLEGILATCQISEFGYVILIPYKKFASNSNKNEIVYMFISSKLAFKSQLLTHHGSAV